MSTGFVSTKWFSDKLQTFSHSRSDPSSKVFSTIVRHRWFFLAWTPQRQLACFFPGRLACTSLIHRFCPCWRRGSKIVQAKPGEKVFDPNTSQLLQGPVVVKDR